MMNLYLYYTTIPHTPQGPHPGPGRSERTVSSAMPLACSYIGVRENRIDDAPDACRVGAAANEQRRRGPSYESQQQGVFHQVLALFLTHEANDRHDESAPFTLI